MGKYVTCNLRQGMTSVECEKVEGESRGGVGTCYHHSNIPILFPKRSLRCHCQQQEGE